MSDHEEQPEQASHHLEGGRVVFDPPKSQIEINRERREHEQHEFARDQVKTNKRLAWFTGLLVLGTFAGISISVWQATISQTAVTVAGRTLNETIRSNQAQEMANKASFQATVDNFHLDQRAWIGISSVEQFSLTPTDAFGVRFNLVNTGHTPAFGVTTEVILHSQPSGEVFRPDIGPVKPGATISASTVLPNGTYCAESATYPISQGQINAIHANITTLYAYGFVKYSDVFGRKHTTRFCKIIAETNKAQDCNTYNFAD